MGNRHLQLGPCRCALFAAGSAVQRALDQHDGSPACQWQWISVMGKEGQEGAAGSPIDAASRMPLARDWLSRLSCRHGQWGHVQVERRKLQSPLAFEMERLHPSDRSMEASVPLTAVADYRELPLSAGLSSKRHGQPGAVGPVEDPLGQLDHGLLPLRARTLLLANEAQLVGVRAERLAHRPHRRPATAARSTSRNRSSRACGCAAPHRSTRT
jgi:hypothetical protein